MKKYVKRNFGQKTTTFQKSMQIKVPNGKSYNKF